MQALIQNLEKIRSYREQRSMRNQGYDLGEEAMLRRLATLLEFSQQACGRRLFTAEAQALEITQLYIRTYVTTPESPALVAAA